MFKQAVELQRKEMNKIALLIIALLLAFNLTGCSLTGVKKLENQAESFGFKSVQLSANGFILSGFYRLSNAPNSQLHVYLEGDGRPWEQGLLPALDPTTHASVMLPLMAMDSSSSLYLGRPCYNGHAKDTGCNNALWTSARYGNLVVETMKTALQDFCYQHGFTELVIIGHSGGGSLAILLANRLPQTHALLTLAVNYDIDAWADYHHFVRLFESLNPAYTFNAGVFEWHYLGEQDINIPPVLFFERLKNRKHSRVEIIPNIDHTKGWDFIWPKILLELANDK